MRKNARNLLSLLLAVLLFATLLAGCGGSGGGDEGGIVEITVADKVDSDAVSFNTERQAAFDEAYPNIKVNHISVTTDSGRMVQSIATIFAGGENVTAMPCSATIYAQDLWNLGMIADISEYVKDLPGYTNRYESIIAASKNSKGNVIGYVHANSVVCFGMFKDALVEAGYDPNNVKCETWDDYAEIAEKLTINGAKGASFLASEYFLWINNWALANGCHLAYNNPDGTITLNFTDEKFVQTVEFWRDLYKKGFVNEVIEYADMMQLFEEIFQKKVNSFTIYPGWINWWSQNGLAFEDIVLMPYPTGPSGTNYSEMFPGCYVFNKNSTDAQIKAAVTYCDFMYGEESENLRVQYNLDQGITTVETSTYSTVNWQAYLPETGADTWAPAINATLDRAQVSDISSSAYSTYLIAVMPELVKGDGDILSALQQAQDTCTREWLTKYNEDALAGNEG